MHVPDLPGRLSPGEREELLGDEEGHINHLETQLNLLNDIGAQLYGQLNAHSADEVPSEGGD